VSNILTDWRKALVAHLEDNLQGGDFKGNVLSGERDGESKDRKLACVFVPSIQEFAQNILFATPPMVIRAWIPKPKLPKAQQPVDPEPVEQLGVDLMSCLEPVEATLLAGRLFFRVGSVDFDYADWGVQASLVSFTDNPATFGA